MKKIFIFFAVIGSFLLLSLSAHALMIVPGNQLTDGTQSGYLDPDTSGILNHINTTYPGLLGPELYKSDFVENSFTGTESGPLSSNYSTKFNALEDPTGATISWLGGYIIEEPAHLLVKDGRNDPVWYLFDLTSELLDWDGMETLYLSGFWEGISGSISHVSLYGTKAQVPEPATLLLFGAGIAGLAMYRRKRS